VVCASDVVGAVMSCSEVSGSIERLDALSEHFPPIHIMEDPMEVQLPGGKSMDVALVANEYVCNLVLAGKSVGARTTALVHHIPTNSRHSGDRRLFIDLGCNLGWFSLVALACGCDVLCVEPNPWLETRLTF